MPKGYKSVSTYTTVDYNILFIFTYFNNNTSQDSTVEPKWRVLGSILQKESNKLSDPFVIYQNPMSQPTLNRIMCNGFNNGSGFYCDLFFSPALNNKILPVND